MIIDEDLPPRRKITLLGREFQMPQSRRWRVTIGILLILGGILGFLPVLGFWMLPLGIFILSYEFAWVRRRRRRATVWWGRRKTGNKENQPPQSLATAEKSDLDDLSR